MSYALRVSDALGLCYPNSLDYVQTEDLERGTRLHFAMECVINNRIMGLGDGGFVGLANEGEVARATNTLWWLDNEEVEFQEAEPLVESPYGYCGHPDLLCAWKGKNIWVDFKFSEAITEQNQMQGNAYTHATKRPGIFLQCNRAGEVKAVKCKDDPTLVSAFLSAVNVLNFIKRGR